MEFLDFIKSLSLTYMDLAIFIVFVTIGFLYKDTTSKKEEKDEDIETRMKNEALCNMGDVRIFKDMYRVVARLENKVYANNKNIAFDFGSVSIDTIFWLEFLNINNTRIIAANYDTIKRNNDTSLSKTITLFLEDDNGVLYLITFIRKSEIIVDEKEFINYLLTPVMVLENESLKELTSTVNTSDLFIPKDVYGTPISENVAKTNIVIDTDEDLMILTLFWNNERNVKITLKVSDGLTRSIYYNEIQ